MKSFYNEHVKRWLDAALSGTLLVATAPIVGAAALAIKLEDGGSIIFAQERGGRYGKPFTLYKLRTMKEGTDKIDGGYPTEDMVTKVGKVLRRTSLDELPQLWNIFIGDMSFIGPRPTLMDQVRRYTGRQYRRLDVRPGLTGVAQIRYRNSAPWSVRIEADLEYVNNVSFLTDLKVILSTIPAVLGATGQQIGMQSDLVDDLQPDPVR